MKVASWYTSLFFVIFVYFYCYLIQYVRGAEIPAYRQQFQPNVLHRAPPTGRVIDGPPTGVRLKPLEYRYHNYDELTAYLQGVAAQYPQITHLYSIGKSVQGLFPSPALTQRIDSLTRTLAKKGRNIFYSNNVYNGYVSYDSSSAIFRPFLARVLVRLSIFWFNFGEGNKPVIILQRNIMPRLNPTNHVTEIRGYYAYHAPERGRDLWVLAISSTPRVHVPLKPDVKYVGNIHGNEPVGREMLLHLIQYLTVNYPSDEYVRWLLDNTRVHILPAMNPDGFEVAREGDCGGVQGRYNIRGYDLNRNFPDYFRQNTRQTQPEVQAVQDWLKDIQFVLSASLHGGALVASYPFDNKPSQALEAFSGYTASLTPDDDVFKQIAQVYSFNHRTMHLGESCSGNKGFKNGTTNGAEWYYLTGGMQDYNYIWHGCLEVTMELSCCKYPAGNELETFWEDNQRALLRYLGEAHRGVLGFVRDISGQPIEKASVKVSNRDVGMMTTKLGEYWRMLLPGEYVLEVYKEGYVPSEIPFVVQEGVPQLLNVTLQRDLAQLPSGNNQKFSSIRPTERPSSNALQRLFSFFG